MAEKYTVMWICEILADDPKDAAVVARRTIANAPYSYFDVYPTNGTETPYQVEVPNDGTYMESALHTYYPEAPKTNN